MYPCLIDNTFCVFANSLTVSKLLATTQIRLWLLCFAESWLQYKRVAEPCDKGNLQNLGIKLGTKMLSEKYILI